MDYGEHIDEDGEAVENRQGEQTRFHRVCLQQNAVFYYQQEGHRCYATQKRRNKPRPN